MSYVLALGFVLSVGIAIFAVGEFLTTDEASVRLFTLFLPWAAIVFVPALAMRAWSQDTTTAASSSRCPCRSGTGRWSPGSFSPG